MQIYSKICDQTCSYCLQDFILSAFTFSFKKRNCDNSQYQCSYCCVFARLAAALLMHLTVNWAVNPFKRAHWHSWAQNSLCWPSSILAQVCLPIIPIIVWCWLTQRHYKSTNFDVEMYCILLKSLMVHSYKAKQVKPLSHVTSQSGIKILNLNFKPINQFTVPWKWVFLYFK